MDKIRLILALLPQIIQTIRELENLLPNAGEGANKLQLFLDLFRAVYDAVDDVKPSFDAIRPLLERVVGAIVAAFNRLGIFKKAV